MEEQQNDALLERAPSTETMPQPRRNSNAKAAKVAGLAVLACLLLAGQAFTAYYVMAQKDHLKSLEQGQETLKKALTRSFSGAPKMMHSPMSKMPLLVGLDEDSTNTGKKKNVPLTRLHASSQREGSGIVDGPRFSPKRMAMPMNSMPLFGEIKEAEASEIPETVMESKCQMEAGKVMPGFFQPQCDEEGNFKPMQCWHSTGYCWCVDKNGKEIPGTLSREYPECGNVN